MTQRIVCFALIAMVTGPFVGKAYSQGGGLLDRAAAGTQSAAQARAQQRAQAQVQQRAQAQVQQRAQAQVQQRANAQVQQRAAGRLQQKIQGQLGSRVRGAVNSAAATSRRMNRQQGNATRLEAGAGVRMNANAAGTEAQTETRIRVNGSGRLVVPGPALRGNGEVNVAYFDNVFGRFNPFRQPEPTATSGTAPSGQQPAENTQPTAPAGGSDQNATAANDNAAQPQQRITGIGAKQSGRLHSQVDLAKAVRLRRSEISAIRDHALTTGNAQLMASADQMEQILDRFTQAQAAAEAQAATAAQTTASGTGVLNSGLNAAATGQASGSLRGESTRVAQRPEDAPAASQPTTTE